jgi:flagellar biogenesis protein FliO
MTEQTIIQAGGIIVALAVIAILSWIVRFLAQHMERTDKTNRELSDAISKNTQVTNELVTYFKAVNGKIIPK